MKYIPQKAVIACGMALLIIGVACVWYVMSRPDIEAFATNIVSECGKESGDHAACYEQLVPTLYPRLSVSQLFEIVRSIRTSDPSYQFCHVLAHKIGERVVAEDPMRWMDAIPLNPSSGTCSNGFIHGVVGGRFRSEVLDESTLRTLLPDFKRACEARDDWHPSDLDRAICYHGLGHLYDFITNADLPRALELCEQTTGTQFHRVCVEGVFMQIYQPLEPDDFALIEQMQTKPTAPTYRRFCASFKDPEYVGACLREAWPILPGMLDGTGMRQYCSGQPNAELEDYCYRSAFTIVGRLLQAQPDDQARACDLAPQARRSMCYSVVADAVLEENRDDAVRAVSFCERASDPRACFDYLIGAAQFNFGYNAGQFDGFCRALPKDIQVRCGAKASNTRSYP